MFLRFAIPAGLLLCSGFALSDDQPKRKATRAVLSAHEVVVRSGESMGLYGRWAKIDMHTLYQRAAIRWNERLRVGRKLAIRMSDDERTRFDAARETFNRDHLDATRAGASDHTVRAGDNPWRIARRLSVPVWAIERLNEGRDWRRLKIGDIIKVPASRLTRR